MLHFSLSNHSNFYISKAIIIGVFRCSSRAACTPCSFEAVFPARLECHPCTYCYLEHIASSLHHEKRRALDLVRPPQHRTLSSIRCVPRSTGQRSPLVGSRQPFTMQNGRMAYGPRRVAHRKPTRARVAGTPGANYDASVRVVHLFGYRDCGWEYAVD